MAVHRLAPDITAAPRAAPVPQRARAPVRAAHAPLPAARAAVLGQRQAARVAAASSLSRPHARSVPRAASSAAAEEAGQSAVRFCGAFDWLEGPARALCVGVDTHPPRPPRSTNHRTRASSPPFFR